MNKCLLFLVFGILLCVDRGGTDKAQKFLNSLDLEEIVEKLLEFDLNQDGQLSEIEVELQQPEIQKYLDRYAELQKAEEQEEEEEDEKEDTDKKAVPHNEKTAQKRETEGHHHAQSRETQQQRHSAQKEQTSQKDTVTPSGSQTEQNQDNLDKHEQEIPDTFTENAAVEDEDDGVEIEVIEDLQFVEDDDTPNYGSFTLPAIVVSLSLGVLTLLYVLFSRAKADHLAKHQQRQEQIIQKREAWLNRLANNQRKKDPEDDQNSPNAKQPPSSSSPAACYSPKPAEKVKDCAAVSPMSKKLAADLTISSKADATGDKSGGPSTQSDKSLNDLSSPKSVPHDSGEPSPKLSNSSVQPSSKASEKADTPEELGQGSGNRPVSQSSASVLASEAPLPPPPEKTTDVEKLKGFLEKVFSCSLTLTDDVPKMRFCGGRMRIPPRDFPTSLVDVEGKMKVLVHQAFDKQVNKVKFSVNTYNMCESSGSDFHDKLVDATMTVIMREAVNTVLSHFQEESKNNSISDSGLWDSNDGDFELNVYQYETYNFLPRLINNSSDGVNISPSLLSRMLSHDKADLMVSSLLHAGGARFLASKRLDEMLLSEMVSLEALEVLMSDTHFVDCLAKVLAMETENAVKHSLGNYFQDQAALSELLKVSTIPGSITGRQKYQPPQAALEPFRSMRTFPDLSRDDISTAQVMIQKGTRRLQQLVFSILRRVVNNKATRDVVLSWLATLVSLNELRTSSVLQDNSDVQPVCSDGFMVNVCAVLLELYLPIGQSVEKLERVDLGYSASPACRLAYDFQPCLAGGQIVGKKGGQGGRPGVLPASLQGQHTFITECFHLTQRALSVTIVPAIKHFNKMHSHFSSQTEQLKDVNKAKEQEVHNQHVLVSVAWETSLMDPDLVYSITTFYISQATLLLKTVNNMTEKQSGRSVEEVQKAQQKALSVVPEFCIKDMAQWFTFLATHVLRVNPNITKGLSLTAFVDCCVMLLERPDLMPGPVPASMIVSALLAFMKDTDKTRLLGGGSTWGSGVMSDLAAMVHTCPSAQTQLGPALLRTYVTVDVVEGLDVDKDSFDKFNTRVQIGQLVEKLWSRNDCRASIVSQCGTDMFQNFLDSILDTLLYMLHDSLSRLANVKKIETLKANEAEWNALSRRQQAEKDMFLRSEENVGSGFMRQAKKTLKFLNLVSQSDTVAHCFTRQPLATRAASTINGFLDSLCGAKAKNFKVKDMAKYQFNPVELLSDIVNVMLRIAVEDVSRTDGYLVSMVKDPDFELANLEKAQSVIVGKGFASEDTTNKLAQLMEQVRKLAAEHCPVLPTCGEDENNWRDAFVDLEIEEQELEKGYASTMEGQRFSCARLLQSHCFANNAQGAIDSRCPKVKALVKELKQLNTSLPVHAGASIFVRHDKDRTDVMRALVTGPVGTPYSLGCFCFDVYFPAAYPNVPPLVKIITTGNGTVRFNPNLYADGKVCLSLLGTWHAGDASEKWNPSKSSLYQVLVSIQSMILTPDPVFNEPGYERIKDTEEGEVQSRQYNWKIHLHTLRHAVLGQLRNPPPGFERVIRQHFALQREMVLKQCAEWVKGCEDPDLLKRLRQVSDAIFEEIMSLDVDFNEVEMDSEDEDEEEEGDED
ncbi:uncharacterized protein LOC143280995 isoform X2 [Babylonia areolata]|uniref:uncharacterized protein LOC143280995 isoform X2 n=1 Tax=Babylonia areolata TaxID=304850 RepID=UPI003FD25A8E